MLPISDEKSSHKIFPFINYVLLALNIFFFYQELTGGQVFIETWAFIPSRFFTNPGGNLLTIFSAMFLHAGWLHLGSNMLYLLIFGDNIESRFGHFKYLIFYLLCGLVGNLAQALINPGSNVPILGASGAIAGVLGAYILLHPTRKINVLAFIFVVRLPALIVIGVWFILQLLNGIGSFDSASQMGGIAYLAHVAGFVTGFLLTFIFRD